MKFFILENGEQMDLTKKQKNHLVKQGLIYSCGGCVCYHLADGITYTDIELSLKGISND